jgi:enoyl-CoA hydratase/carnithine racemase
MMSAEGPRERRWYAQLGRRALEAIERSEALTIARLHGHVVGGGLVLALGCDFRLAAEGTRISLPEVDLGLPLTWGATPRLIREIGSARAREMILGCEVIDAQQALDWGLVHRQVPEAELDSLVDDWANRYAQKPEAAIHMAKTQLRAYLASQVLGDVTEGDGDLLIGASTMGTGRKHFGAKA